jgi:hypothetical protein
MEFICEVGLGGGAGFLLSLPHIKCLLHAGFFLNLSVNPDDGGDM